MRLGTLASAGQERLLSPPLDPDRDQGALLDQLPDPRARLGARSAGSSRRRSRAGAATPSEWARRGGAAGGGRRARPGSARRGPAEGAPARAGRTGARRCPAAPGPARRPRRTTPGRRLPSDQPHHGPRPRLLLGRSRDPSGPRSGSPASTDSISAGRSLAKRGIRPYASPAAPSASATAAAAGPGAGDASWPQYSNRPPPRVVPVVSSVGGRYGPGGMKAGRYARGRAR